MNSGNHMLNLLNDILDISKNKHLAHEMARDKAIFQSLAFESIDGMKSLAMSRNTRLTCQILPRDEKDAIVTDRTKIIQIVSNTVNNAIKFSDEGSIDVKFELLSSILDAARVWAESARSHAGVVFAMNEGEMLDDVEKVLQLLSAVPNPPNSKWMCISVSDTGCGMSPTELSKMFSPYTQSSARSNRAFQGTGLGLYICVSLCHQLSGFIACGSTPEVGTTFVMGIPVEFLGKQLENEGRESPTPAPVTEEILMTGPVMVVDDNQVNLKILHRALTMQFKTLELDLEVICASGGLEAIELFKKHHPSLCIIDYHMPEIDGIETTLRLRSYEQENGLSPSYVMSYTADATDQAKADILKAGADDIMSKPPPKGFLANLARRLVDHRGLSKSG
jgi:CheY-like chemotaxis protein